MKLKNIVLYFIALSFMAMGITLYLRANIGVGAWDVLHNNLTEFFFNLTIGTWVFIVGIITVTVSQLLNFNLKTYLSVITGFIMGQLMDLFLVYVFTVELNVLYMQIIYFTFSLIFLGSGISLLVLTKLPPTPPDVLMLGVVKRFNLSFTKSKTATEIGVLIVAILVGLSVGKPFNNVGIGTVLTTILVGIVVGTSRKLWRKLLNL